MLNPALDHAALAAAFARHGRLQIDAALVPEAAASLHDCLAGDFPWSCALTDAAGRPETVAAERLAAMPAAERAALRAEVHRNARRGGYQFIYHNYMMVSAYKAGRDPHLPLGRLLEFLNSPSFLEPMRAITGAADVARTDGQATCYLPGDFLRHHTDHDEHMGRRVAYVLGLTRGWQADWGGLLHFLDADGGVIDTFLPRYNTLTLFRVPTPHCVSMVASYATAPRLSITGWLMRAAQQRSSL